MRLDAGILVIGYYCGIRMRFGNNGATSASVAISPNWCQRRFVMGVGRASDADIPIRWCSPAALRQVGQE